jgi:hypothetical protein
MVCGTRGIVYALDCGWATGILVQEYLIKAEQRAQQLQRIIRQENLSPADRATATQVLEDLKDALSTIQVHP